MNLKPCPFCGSENIEVESWGVVEFRGYDKQDADVECKDCTGSVSYTSEDPINDGAGQGAVNKWNRRFNESN